MKRVKLMHVNFVHMHPVSIAWVYSTRRHTWWHEQMQVVHVIEQVIKDAGRGEA